MYVVPAPTCCSEPLMEKVCWLTAVVCALRSERSGVVKLSTAVAMTCPAVLRASKYQ